MTHAKSRFLYSLVFLILAPALGTAQQAGGQLVVQQQPTLGAPEDWELNRDANIQAYVDLLRSNLREQKVQVLSQVMAFSPGDASKFWPIYNEYDAELTKLKDHRVEFIKEYVDNYGILTDEQADEMVYGLLDLLVERTGLLRKYYDRVKGALDPITAARFLQIESQLLKIVDLQIMSSLPAVE